MLVVSSAVRKISNMLHCLRRQGYFSNGFPLSGYQRAGLTSTRQMVPQGRATPVPLVRAGLYPLALLPLTNATRITNRQPLQARQLTKHIFRGDSRSSITLKEREVQDVVRRGVACRGVGLVGMGRDNWSAMGCSETGRTVHNIAGRRWIGQDGNGALLD